MLSVHTFVGLWRAAQTAVSTALGLQFKRHFTFLCLVRIVGAGQDTLCRCLEGQSEENQCESRSTSWTGRSFFFFFSSLAFEKQTQRDRPQRASSKRTITLPMMHAADHTATRIVVSSRCLFSFLPSRCAAFPPVRRLFPRARHTARAWYCILPGDLGVMTLSAQFLCLAAFTSPPPSTNGVQNHPSSSFTRPSRHAGFRLSFSLADSFRPGDDCGMDGFGTSYGRMQSNRLVDDRQPHLLGAQAEKKGAS